MFVVAGAVLPLLFVSIHNAWDALYSHESKNRRSREWIATEQLTTSAT
jgi:hypothetical protein